MYNLTTCSSLILGPILAINLYSHAMGYVWEYFQQENKKKKGSIPTELDHHDCRIPFFFFSAMLSHLKNHIKNKYAF